MLCEYESKFFDNFPWTTRAIRTRGVQCVSKGGSTVMKHATCMVNSKSVCISLLLVIKTSIVERNMLSKTFLEIVLSSFDDPENPYIAMYLRQIYL